MSDLAFASSSAPDRAAFAGAVLDIDLDAIVSNWRSLSAVAGGVPAAAVVKADAYGLGAVPVASALAAAGCKSFFVAHLDEAIALRAVLAKPEIFVLHGISPGGEAETRAHRLTPVLSTLGQIAAWAAEARRCGRRLPAALHVDTGMARLGLSEAEVDTLAAEPARLADIEPRLVMSHLAAAEDQANPSNARQLARFRLLRAKLPAMTACFANSSGVFLGADYHFDLLRPGAALYGVAPVVGRPNPLSPVVRLAGRVLRIDTLAADTPVGYGGTYVTTAPTRIATLSIGYADGFLRALAGRARAGLDGVKLPLVGAVSMDMITVDVSALAEGRVKEGDLIDVIGGSADDVDAVARAAGTIGYEILTSLGRRYARRWLGSSSL